MGSGKVLKRAIERYGLSNFRKDILHIFDNEADMNAKEIELVVISEETYNLCPGGHGGFGHINSNKELIDKRAKTLSKKMKERFQTGELTPNQIGPLAEATKRKISFSMKTYCSNGSSFSGKNHTEEWKVNHSKIMKISQSRYKNSQFGSIWVTNGINNKKIKKDLDVMPEGWYKGRTICVRRLMSGI